MTAPARRYPAIPDTFSSPTRPISFVCVKYSDEFRHNLLTSPCVHDNLNELIVVDNTDNLRFRTLSAAMIEGFSSTRHDLVVFVHEDVVLLPNWQAMFEAALGELEAQDPDWRVIGVAGWDGAHNRIGHFSDPETFCNTFTTANFTAAESLDAHLLVLRRSAPVPLDANLPGIHNIGQDVPRTARMSGGGCYVINAPSIHKFADNEGNEIIQPRESVKIKRRRGLQAVAGRECSDEYLVNKWGLERPEHPTARARAQYTRTQGLGDEVSTIVDSPIVLVGQGRAGTRLLSRLSQDLDLFVGNDVNEMGDSREMARAVYRSIFRKYQCPSDWQKTVIEPDLRASAENMLQKAGWPKTWGFKLPEALFVLDEIMQVFPRARFVFLSRDPNDLLVQRPHLTVQLDRPIGQIALRLAYSAAGIPVERASSDAVELRVALTTLHQFSLVADFKPRLPDERWIDLRFEDIITDPLRQLTALGEFCGIEPITSTIDLEVDSERASKKSTARQIDAALLNIVRPARIAMGYEPPASAETPTNRNGTQKRCAFP